jgi:hypothetical protein
MHCQRSRCWDVGGKAVVDSELASDKSLTLAFLSFKPFRKGRVISKKKVNSCEDPF